MSIKGVDCDDPAARSRSAKLGTQGFGTSAMARHHKPKVRLIARARRATEDVMCQVSDGSTTWLEMT